MYSDWKSTWKSPWFSWHILIKFPKDWRYAKWLKRYNLKYFLAKFAMRNVKPISESKLRWSNNFSLTFPGFLLPKQPCPWDEFLNMIFWQSFQDVESIVLTATSQRSSFGRIQWQLDSQSIIHLHLPVDTFYMMLSLQKKIFSEKKGMRQRQV